MPPPSKDHHVGAHLLSTTGVALEEAPGHLVSSRPQRMRRIKIQHQQKLSLVETTSRDRPHDASVPGGADLSALDPHQRKPPKEARMLPNPPLMKSSVQSLSVRGTAPIFSVAGGEEGPQDRPQPWVRKKMQPSPAKAPPQKMLLSHRVALQRLGRAGLRPLLHPQLWQRMSPLQSDPSNTIRVCYQVPWISILLRHASLEHNVG